MKNTYVIALLAVTTATLLSGCATHRHEKTKNDVTERHTEDCAKQQHHKCGTKSKKTHQHQAEE
ncbi:hypothetical protein B9J09_10045 [Xylella fastidiosa subsp. pauca]|uniref:hypothetical protein n=1 Tax=Xylella fastidiosa TaxID=2371 RepID=UPI0006233AC1|nr:hypothetical protein [Xylella fastidiosa]ARO69312.1 hypothetical protein B9J09_10045 [Xylella fastidiosa subsp. pauca]AVI21334.1 hypothetical protein BCV75_09355 [Xylella fastidiosa]AVI23368.1 hypothetical protein BC375_09415 [Xylella fastidiosa]KXB16002.1 hypothetical protein ADT33_04170 [Xylella fastidiosa]KXB19840.1 hypothetical protein ADT31_00730 [Xylella fastidiosa]